MGFSIDDLFGQAKEAVNKGLEDVKAIGIPALQSAGEKWAANALQDAAKSLGQKSAEHDAALQTNVKELLSRPQEPGSFGSYFSQTIQGAGIGAYGPMILIGVAGLVLFGVFMGKK